MPTPAEMAAGSSRRRAKTGIGLTLLPVFYAHGELRRRGAKAGTAALHQRRRRASRVCWTMPAPDRRTARRSVGVAPHSLRAVTPERTCRRRRPRRPAARSTSTSPSRSRKSRTASPGPARGRCAGCWTMRRSTTAGAWSMRRTWTRLRRETLARSRRGRRPMPDHRGQSRRRHLQRAAFLRHRRRFGVGIRLQRLIGAAAELRQLEYAQRLHARARNVWLRQAAPAGGRCWTLRVSAARRH